VYSYTPVFTPLPLIDKKTPSNKSAKLAMALQYELQKEMKCPSCKKVCCPKESHDG